jgi:hypothetical protein
MPATSFFDPSYVETVYAALFAQLQTATFPGGLKIQQARRVLIPPDEVPAGSQPAMFLVPGPLHTEEKNFALAKWTFTAVLLIYLRTDSAMPPSVLPQTSGFNLLWGFVNALYADVDPPYGKQTLGGLVYHCWIEGEVIVSTASEQAVISIPIYMLAGDVG